MNEWLQIALLLVGITLLVAALLAALTWWGNRQPPPPPIGEDEPLMPSKAFIRQIVREEIKASRTPPEQEDA